jgi:hypothetical protein
MIREGDAGAITPFNFQRWCGKNALIYKPDYNSKYFRHSGNTFH